MKVNWAPLGDVLRLAQDAVAVQAEETYPSAGVLNRGRGLFAKGILAGSDTSYARLFRLHAGQVVYSKLFGWEGAVAIVPQEFAGHFVSSEFPTFDVAPDRVGLDYLQHYLKSQGFTDQMARSTNGLGQRRQRVNVDAFLRIEVPLPARTEQDRIAAHLSALASIVTPKPRMQLAFFRESVFRDLTKHDVGRRKLREIVRPRASEPVLPDKAYAIGGVYGFARGIIHRPTLLGTETKYQTLTPALQNDIVYSKLKAFEGAVAVASAQDNGRYFSPEFPVFEPTATDVRPGYLEQVLLSPPVLRALAEQSTGVGARRERVHPAKFLDLEVPIPTPAEQESVTDLCRRVAEGESLASRAERLANAILPAARNDIFTSMR